MKRVVSASLYFWRTSLKAILLIEDDGAVRRPVKRQLEKRGYTVLEAASLAEARVIIATCDVVVSDTNLGDGDGPMLHRASKNEVLAKLKIGWVAITGAASEAQFQYYADQGIEVVLKPIDIDALVRAVEKAYRRQPSP